MLTIHINFLEKSTAKVLEVFVVLFSKKKNAHTD